MIGLLILAVVFGYIFLSKFIINKTYEKYNTKKAKYIAMAIMILIPTWDIILGFPIYAYLCLTKAGVHIYKTIDNVEGFYIGAQDTQYEPYKPYKGYKYVEYQGKQHGKPTGKYYKSYWINYYKDTNEFKYCISPKYPNSPTHPYTKAFNEGRCIVKKEIPESEVSRWEYHYGSIEKAEIFPLGIKQIELAFVKDLNEHKQVAVANYIWWKAGLITGYFLTGWGATFTPSGFECGYTRELNFLNKTLKPKKGNQNGND